MIRFLLTFLVFHTLHSFGQHQANIWYFGNGVGLDFNNGCTPNVLTDGAIDGFEGCATIADNTTGELLFYTNSAAVWNREHLIMPDGFLIEYGNTITQVTIVPKPGSSSLYYIITSEIQGWSGQGYRFHQVDMTLNNNLGGLSFKDSLLYSFPVTEKIIPVPHANGSDIWLIGHEYNSNQFLAFLVTSSGIETNPVISSIGKVHFDESTIDAIGEIKVSPNTEKLAVVTAVSPNIELFDFDNSNGEISNLITLPEAGGYGTSANASGLYGLSFSSDNSKLYASQWLIPTADVLGKLIQYDITSNDSALINNSRVDIFTSPLKSLYSLKLAPDRKIYVGQNVSSQYIGVIHYPDSSGLSCMYSDNGLYLNGKTASWGLNNLMEYDNYCDLLGSGENGSDLFHTTVFPNPFSVQTVLQTDYPLRNATLSIDNCYGHNVTQISNINVQNVILRRDNLPSGLYVIRLTQGDAVIATEKLIIVDQ